MKQGFTLIELLVVVLIIGILTAVAVPQYRRSIVRAEAMEAFVNLKTIFESAKRIRSTNSEDPDTFSALDVAFFEGEEEVILAALKLLPEYDKIKLESKSTILAEKNDVTDIYDYYQT